MQEAIAMELMEAPQHWLELETARLPYWKIGQGPDLVFVHGWPLDARTYRASVEILRERFTCHLFDLPGLGRSEWGAQTQMGVAAMGEYVQEACEAMEIEGSFGLIGHDSGGTFARLAAAEMGDRVAGLALANTEIPNFHPWRLKLLLGLTSKPWMQSPLRAIVSRVWGRSMMLAESVPDRGVREEVGRLFLKPLSERERALKGAMAFAASVVIEDFDLLVDAHPKITAPVRLIWGVDDPYFPLARCEEMVDSFGGEVDLVPVEGCGLLVEEEKPAQFAAQVREHFESCFAAPVGLRRAG